MSPEDRVVVIGAVDSDMIMAMVDVADVKDVSAEKNPTLIW